VFDAHTIHLSKSRYLSGLQCELKLWNDAHARELAAPVTAAQQHLFDVGKVVGRQAQRRYPGGVAVEADYLHFGDALAQTSVLQADPHVPAIYEAALTHRGATTRVDILARSGTDAWDLIEVKSTLSVKDTHINDLSVQYWIAAHAGLTIRNAGLLTLNKEYVYPGGPYDVEALFAFHDRTEWIRRMAELVGQNVDKFLQILHGAASPDIRPGDHCFNPYPCPYYQACTRDMVLPEHPIEQLPALNAERRMRLLARGIVAIQDIPEDFSLSGLQSRVRRSIIDGAEYISAGLAASLNAPEFPIHHLDFETFMPALPRYPGTHTYQALPFQWSNHIETAGGEVFHDEYLSDQDADPRLEFARTLLDTLADRGTICIYSPYERRIIAELASALPALAPRLEALEGRFWDLCAVIKDDYYHPDFGGSFSLKKVLPALVPEMSYSGLDIQDGDAASRSYLEAIESADLGKRDKILAHLRTYCGQDTLALVRLRHTLRARVAAHGK